MFRHATVFYNNAYARSPKITLAITNASLAAIGDILAQSGTYITYRQSRTTPTPLEQKRPETLKENILYEPPPPKFDPWRLARITSYGFIIAPVVGKWFGFLEKRFPLPAGMAGGFTNWKGTIVPTLRRVAADQILFAPIGMSIFFTVITAMEGGGWTGIQEKFRDAYLPAMIANYKVWPAVQFINFRLMPLQFRVPFVSFIGIFWTGYLSWINNAAKQEHAVETRIAKRDQRMETQRETLELSA